MLFGNVRRRRRRRRRLSLQTCNSVWTLTFDCSVVKVMTFPLEGVTLRHVVSRGWALVLDDLGFSSALPLKHSMTLW